MRRLTRQAALLLVSLLALSLVGGLAVAEVSQGFLPTWAEWGSQSVAYEGPSVLDGFLVGHQADALLFRSTSFAIYPEHLRTSYDEYQLFLGSPSVVKPTRRMLQEAEDGFLRSFRGSVGPVIGIWSWHWQTQDQEPRALAYPETGVTRVLGIPLAYRPVMPGFLIAWAASYGFAQVVVLAGRHLMNQMVKLIRRKTPGPGQCCECSYDLTGVQGVCPECGAPLGEN